MPPWLTVDVYTDVDTDTDVDVDTDVDTDVYTDVDVDTDVDTDVALHGAARAGTRGTLAAPLDVACSRCPLGRPRPSRLTADLGVLQGPAHLLAS